MKIKTALLSAAILAFFSQSTSAQFNTAARPAASAVKPSASRLLSTIANAFNQASFIATLGKDKKAWVSKVQASKTPQDLSKALAELAANIKPTLLETPFTGSIATTTGGFASQLLAFEKAVKSSAFSDAWKLQRTNWLAQVASLK